jgi:hypothetical protein
MYRKHKYNFLLPLAIGEKDAASGETPAVTAAAKHLIFGRGSEIWNAHLRAMGVTIRRPMISANELSSSLPSSSSPRSSSKDGDGTTATATTTGTTASEEVSTLEILQQAQERLVFPPTRFPPRDSPLHQIFAATATPKGDRRIFGPLEECYREMLSQDAGLEDQLRREYKALLKKNKDDNGNGTNSNNKNTTNDNTGINDLVLLRRRAGQMLVQGKRLQREEHELLTKLKAGLDGFLR